MTGASQQFRSFWACLPFCHCDDHKLLAFACQDIWRRSFVTSLGFVFPCCECTCTVHFFPACSDRNVGAAFFLVGRGCMEGKKKMKVLFNSRSIQYVFPYYFELMRFFCRALCVTFRVERTRVWASFSQSKLKTRRFLRKTFSYVLPVSTSVEVMGASTYTCPGGFVKCLSVWSKDDRHSIQTSCTHTENGMTSTLSLLPLSVWNICNPHTYTRQHKCFPRLLIVRGSTAGAVRNTTWKNVCHPPACLLESWQSVLYMEG